MITNIQFAPHGVSLYHIFQKNSKNEVWRSSSSLLRSLGYEIILVESFMTMIEKRSIRGSNLGSP